MQVTLDFGYEQVLELARQLRPEERERLTSELDDGNNNFEADKEERLRLALECPVATQEELERLAEFKEMFRCCE